MPATWMRSDGEPGQILQAWPQLMEAVGAVAKDHEARGVPYKFRSIEDVVARLQPALVKLGVACTITTSSLHRSSIPTAKGGSMQSAAVHVLLRLIAADGTWLELEADGAALDSSDKDVNKATTAGVKNALLHGLMIRTDDPKRDPDASRPDPSKGPRWSRKAAAVIQQIEKCSAPEEVQTLMDSEAYRQVPEREARDVRQVAVAAYKRLLARSAPGGPDDWPAHNFDLRQQPGQHGRKDP